MPRCLHSYSWRPQCCCADGESEHEEPGQLRGLDVWGGAVALATVSTRNPFYLTLNLLAVSVVYVALPRDNAQRGIWGLVIKIGLLVAGMTIAFNLLTAHAGDQTLTHLPSRIPIIGGEITGNAFVYGLSTAAAILTLIVTAAVFGSVVDRASLLRAVPASLSSAGIAAVIGLSFFPQTLVSLRDVREAQAARGFRVRSIRDVRPLVIPVMTAALEGAFNLAESMESRAFGSQRTGSQHRTWPFISGVMLTLAAVSLLIGGQTIPASADGRGRHRSGGDWYVSRRAWANVLSSHRVAHPR